MLISGVSGAGEIDNWDMNIKAKIDIISSNNVSNNFTYSARDITFEGEAESILSLRDSTITFIRPSENKESLALVELDFQGKKLTNSHTPRFKHAFYRYENVTAGYTWSNFADFITQPESLSYKGHKEGVAYARRLQLKLTHGNWAFALEQNHTNSRKQDSENYFDYQNPTRKHTNLVISEDIQNYPDLTLKYRSHSRAHYLSASAVLRNHSLIKSTKWGYGVNLTGRANTVLGELRAGIIAGKGIGSMLDKDAFIDAIESTDGSFLTSSIHSYASITNEIDDKIKVGLTISGASIKKPKKHKAVLETSQVLSASINGQYEHSKKLSFGLEVKHNSHKINGEAISMHGTSFSEQRFLASTTYKF